MIESRNRRVESSGDTDCGVRLAPIYAVNSTILVLAIAWLVVLLRG